MASLRVIAGRHPDDRLLTELVGQLAVNSPEFASLCFPPSRTHLYLGREASAPPPRRPLPLTFENLLVPGTSGHRLIAYTAEPGSPSETALRLLGSPTTTPVAGYPTAVRR